MNKTIRTSFVVDFVITGIILSIVAFFVAPWVIQNEYGLRQLGKHAFNDTLTQWRALK
jgi:hypothetical protein